MSGHSKWSTIKRKKGANDAARAKIFIQIGMKLSAAVKKGPPDPRVHSTVREVISQAT